MKDQAVITEDREVPTMYIDFIMLEKSDVSHAYLFAKRLMDIIGALIGLIILVVLYPFIALAIKLDSAGSIIFKQERIGKDGERFMMYKFRTMVEGAHELIYQLDEFKNSGSTFLQRNNDPRITKIGKFLRQWSIDELPQFINVLKGDMSLVGPRPFVIEDIKKLKTAHLHRLEAKPGITGYAQISGRNDLPLEERMERDLYYIENRNIWMDISILMKTIWTVLFHYGAY